MISHDLCRVDFEQDQSEAARLPNWPCPACGHGVLQLPKGFIRFLSSATVRYGIEEGYLQQSDDHGVFCAAMQWLGLYVASFLLIAGFMRIVGRIAWWKSLLTAFVFTAAMFVTFDIAFDVIMPKGPLEAAFGY